MFRVIGIVGRNTAAALIHAKANLAFRRQSGRRAVDALDLLSTQTRQLLGEFSRLKRHSL